MKALRLVMIGIRENKKPILTYLIPVLVLELVSVYFLYLLNGHYGNLYQGITDRNTKLIWHSIGMFTALAMSLVAIDGYAGYFLNRVGFEIRSGLTTYCLKVIKMFEKTNMFEQRVQEDVAKFADSICNISIALMRAGIKLPVFLYVIIGLTKWYIGLAIVVAVIVATFATKLAAKRLVPLQAIQEGNEADFRNKLTVTGFDVIRAQFLKINDKLKLLSFVQSGAQQFFVLLPFMVLMPLYITHAVTVKGFFQARNALDKIIGSLMVIIDNRQLIVQIESCLLRLDFLVKADDE